MSHVEGGRPPVSVQLDGQPGTLVRSDDGRCVILPTPAIKALNGVERVAAIITGVELGSTPIPIAEAQMPTVTGTLVRA